MKLAWEQAHLCQFGVEEPPPHLTHSSHQLALPASLPKLPLIHTSEPACRLLQNYRKQIVLFLFFFTRNITGALPAPLPKLPLIHTSEPACRLLQNYRKQIVLFLFFFTRNITGVTEFHSNYSCSKPAFIKIDVKGSFGTHFIKLDYRHNCKLLNHAVGLKFNAGH